MRREERRALRMIERDAERKASIDPLVEGRARGRDCGDCGVCDGIPPCGWRQGLLLENHAPHNVGVILDAVMLPSGDPFTRITELWDGARTGAEAANMVRTLAQRGPLIVTTPKGAIVSVLSPDERATRFVVQELAKIKTVEANIEEEADSEAETPKIRVSIDRTVGGTSET